ncbi:hypothetical protein VTL71DRAFT_8351 [Oculimacula yallundae]|uniref:Uncharacterized protein n=1 Tax=Oculimacula yallundae TaxID=86028 RepID=A0ABR4CYV8_9HELO
MAAPCACLAASIACRYMDSTIGLAKQKPLTECDQIDYREPLVKMTARRAAGKWREMTGQIMSTSGVRELSFMSTDIWLSGRPITPAVIVPRMRIADGIRCDVMHPGRQHMYPPSGSLLPSEHLLSDVQASTYEKVGRLQVPPDRVTRILMATCRAWFWQAFVLLCGLGAESFYRGVVEGWPVLEWSKIGSHIIVHVDLNGQGKGANESCYPESTPIGTRFPFFSK